MHSVTIDDLIQYQQSPTIALRNALTIRLMPLVRRVARRLSQDDWRSFFDDFCQVGAIAVLKTLDRVADGFMPINLAAYFCLQIKGGIRNWLKSQYRKFYKLGGQYTFICPPVADQSDTMTLHALIDVQPIQGKEQEVDLLYVALARLPQYCREAVRLTFLEQRSRSDVCQLLGISARVLQAQLKQALHFLQSTFGVKPSVNLSLLRGVRDNSTLAQVNRDRCSQQWLLIDPQGKEIKVSNLNQFCQDNGLQSAKLCLVAQGKRTHHKQWKCQKIASSC